MRSPVHIGDIRLDVICEQCIPGSPVFKLFPTLTEAELETCRPLLEPNFLAPGSTRLILPKNTVVVRVAGKTILIDTCLGNDKTQPHWPDWDHKTDTVYMDELKRLGLTVEDIDYVLCTHLHADHIGWNTRLDNGRWVPTFPNATYVFSREEHTFWSQCEIDHRVINYNESVLPIIEHKRELLVDDDFEIIDGVQFFPTPGHSPHHCAVHLKSGDRDAVVCGDAIYSRLQLLLPHLTVGSDWDPELGLKTRRHLIERFADTDTLMAPIHFPAPTFGHFISRGDAFDVRFVE